jgi:hypothetical protein
MNLLFLLILFPFSVFAQGFNNEVALTSGLRQDVELLSHEVETLKKSQQSEMDVYIQRYQEVTALVLKEKFRMEQLQSQIKLSQQMLESHSKKILSKSSENWLKSFWMKYEQSLKSAHPLYGIKLQERLNKLKIDLTFKKISYEHALLQTWFVLENDLNKSQDAEFILSPLQVGEKLYHVEMVRLGRTTGYFRTAQGQYGQLSYNTNWDVSFYQDPSSISMIETLLTQFKQQQKTGLFNLPGIKL